MTAPRGKNGDPQDKSYEASCRAWAELEVEMMEKYRHIPLEQFTAIISHELLLKGGEDAGLRLPIMFDMHSPERNYTLHDRAEKRAQELWHMCQPKPSVAELKAESVAESTAKAIEELKTEIEKLRNEVSALSTNGSTYDRFLSCLGFIFLIVIVAFLVRWILIH